MLLVCQNPTMDRQVFVDDLIPGSVLRATRNRLFPGGKPINVGRAARAHAVEAALLILLPEVDQGYRQRLIEEGADARVHPVPGQLRDTVILYEASGRVTVINGPGIEVDPSVWGGFIERAGTEAEGQEWVAVTGSFPRGVRSGDVGDLIRAIRDAGAKVALDTGPQWFMAGLEAGVDLVTPNLAEARQALTGKAQVEAVEVPDTAEHDALEAARHLAGLGVEHVVVTVGATGCAWANGPEAGFLPALDVPVVNPIGAGDAFLGGLLASLERGEDFREAVAWGSATAASAVGQWVPGGADADRTGLLRRRLP